MSAKDSITTQTCELSQEEFNNFLSLYPIPSKYHVILPKSNQTVFDAPPRYVGLYTHSFSLANLRLPRTKFFSYGCEPYIDLFYGFFDLCRAGKWLTFAKRSEKHILNLLPKVITRIEGWHELFFYVQDSIIPAKYPQLLSEQNKLDLKSFNEKLPPYIKENPMFQRLSRYPTSVRVFPDPILLLAGLKPSWEHGQQRHAIMAGGKGIYLFCFFIHFPFSLIYDLFSLFVKMAFRNFIYTKDDEDLTFLPKEPSLGFGTGSPSVLVNTKPLKANEKLDIQSIEVTTNSGGNSKPELFVVHPWSVAARIKDRKCKTRGDSDDDEGPYDVLEIKDANACHLKISAITPPA
nr:hypothetical protein [Tanacetum cinerariifolium]